MSLLSENDKNRAETILLQLTGMSIVSAQELLSWCSKQLLNQPVGEWHRVNLPKE